MGLGHETFVVFADFVRDALAAILIPSIQGTIRSKNHFLGATIAACAGIAWAVASACCCTDVEDEKQHKNEPLHLKSI